jgi:RHS repeat-associated protein
VPEQGVSLFSYDGADQLVGEAHGLGADVDCGELPDEKVTRGYDLLSRLTKIDYPDSTPDVEYEYDGNGNLTRSARGANGTWSYDYNDNGKLKSETLEIDGRTYSAVYKFDKSGHLSSYETPSGRKVSLAPDGYGRATTTLVDMTDGVNKIEYHPDGRLKSLSYRNGYTTAFGLDARQLLSSIASTHDDQPAVLDWTFVRRADARVQRITDNTQSKGNRTFDYDEIGRLEGATGPWGAAAYTYDGLGNLLTKTLAGHRVELDYDDQNRLQQVKDSLRGPSWIPYSHDDRGNVTDNGSLRFTYDSAGQATVVSGSVTGTYSYDGNFKRVRQVVDGRTIYSMYGRSGALLFRDDATTGTSTDYLHVDQQNVLRVDSDDTVTYLHNDHLGSVVAGTNSSGAVVFAELYGPYGEQLLDPAANRDATGFTGHVEDAATSLTYMQARYYDPVIGRFLSTDAAQFDVENPSTFNRYSYVGNDPVNAIDPSGNEAITLGFLIVTVGEFLAVTGIAALGTAVLVSAADAYENYMENADSPDSESESENTAPDPAPPEIARQRQDGHVEGTPQHRNRVKEGKPTSTFDSREIADQLTQEAWQNGSTVRNRPNLREYDFGRPVGKGPRGGSQSRVRVHQDASGRIHGHPSGPETPL